MTPEQCRAARALKDWSQKKLAEMASISPVTLNNFERGKSFLNPATNQAIKVLFIEAGVDFIPPYGVQLRTEGVQIFKGEDALRSLWNDAFGRMKDLGGEILITNVDEARTIKAEGSAFMEHIERLKRHRITERLLTCEGDQYTIMPKKCYRWISRELFTLSMSSYIYLDTVAYQMWNKSMIVLIQDKDAADAERKRFEALWENAQNPKWI